MDGIVGETRETDPGYDSAGYAGWFFSVTVLGYRVSIRILMLNTLSKGKNKKKKYVHFFLYLQILNPKIHAKTPKITLNIKIHV